MVAGVSTGIARHLNIDPTLVRLAFIVAAVAGGVGFAAYLAAFLLIPEEGADEAPIRHLGSHRTATIAGVALLVVAAVATFDAFDGDSLGGTIIWACVLAGAGGFLLVRAQGDTAQVTADHTIATGQAPPRRRSRASQTVAGVLLLVAAGVAAAAAAGADVGWKEGVAIALIAAGGVLVVGSFFGASPWLVVPPLLVAAGAGAMIAAGAVFDGPIGERSYAPVRAAELPDAYRVAIGELRVDLRDVRFPEGTTHLKVQIGIGEARVFVPEDVEVRIDGHTGAGEIRFPGGDSDGTDVDRTETLAAPGRPVLDLEVRAGMGEIRVERG
jgi:phage shock protein PspC (stress-responsive transcriptional regulator)